MRDKPLHVPVSEVEISVPGLLQDILTYQADLIARVKGLELIGQEFPLNSPVPMRSIFGFQYVAPAEYSSGGALDEWASTLFHYYELYKEVISRLDAQVTAFVEQDSGNSTSVKAF